MRKDIKIIIMLILFSVFALAGEDSVKTLTGINHFVLDDVMYVELETDNLVSYFSSNRIDNNLIIDITDCQLGMPDVPIKPEEKEVSLIQTMQLKDIPPVVRVIIVLNGVQDFTTTSKGNKVVVQIKKEISEEKMENKLEKMMSYSKQHDTISKEKEESFFVSKKQDVNIKDKDRENNIIKKLDKPEDIPDEDTINFNFSGMTIREIFETVSNLTGLNIIVDGEVKERKINLFIQDLPVNQVFELVCTSTGLAKHRYNSNTYIVSENDKAKDMLAFKEQSIFRLKNAEAKEVLNLIKGNQKLSSKIKMENYSVDERINAILAYDTPENLELVEKIISDFDKKNGQVTIELHLVEMQREDLNNFGLEFGQYPITPNTVDILNIPSNIKVYSRLEALAEKNKANILSSPKIRIVHKKKAVFEITDEIPVPFYTYEDANKYTVEGTNTNLRVLEPLKQYRKEEVGIKLTVEPYIHDNKEVSLDLDIDISDLSKIDSDGQLYTSTRTTKTFVRLKDRETAILGGLIKQEESNKESNLPGFTKIPLLRALFRNRKKESKNMEMLMFITPFFVNKDGEADNVNISTGEHLKKIPTIGNMSENSEVSSDDYYNVVGELKKVSQ